MKTERPEGDDAADATSEWLDGLAGRPGTEAVHGDGARVRAALAPDALDAPMASWHDIESRAGAGTAVDGAPAPAGLLSTGLGRAGPTVAANDPSSWRNLAWAAAVALGLGLVTLLSPTTPRHDQVLRGVTDQRTNGPRWLVERPSESAQALAHDLRALQADVTVTSEGDAVILDIRARPGTADAVNSRLAALETGLDAEGRLRLTVVPRR